MNIKIFYRNTDMRIPPINEQTQQKVDIASINKPLIYQASITDHYSIMNCLMFEENTNLGNYELKPPKYIKGINFKALKDKLLETNIYNTIKHKMQHLIETHTKKIIIKKNLK